MALKNLVPPPPMSDMKNINIKEGAEKQPYPVSFMNWLHRFWDATANIESSSDSTNTSLAARMNAQEKHANIYVNGNTSAVVLPAQDSWVQYTHFDTNGPSNGLTADHTNDHILIDESGTFFVSVATSFSGSASTDFEVQVFTNNGATGFPGLHFERKLGASGDIGAASLAGLAAFTAGSTVELWVQRTDGGAVSKNYVGRDVSFTVKRVL